MKNLILIISLISLFLASCAPQMTREQVAAGFNSQNSLNEIDVKTYPFFEIGRNGLMCSRSGAGLVRGFFVGNKINPLICLVVYSSEWYFLEGVYVHGYGKIVFQNIDRKIDAKSYSVGVIESPTFNLPKSFLATHKERGIPIKLSGEKGDIELVIPSYYIQGYLDALEH